MFESYLINQKCKIPTILLYGYIGKWQENDSKRFVSDFKKLEAENKQINIRINSGGGDVFDGITIYNTLKNSTSEINIFIDGLCASMASVIALAGKSIKMSKYAQLMIHKVSGNASGDAEKLIETANLMQELENSIVQIYSERTGIDKEQINNTWMKRGSETWVNSTNALKLKLVDEIFDGYVKEEAPISNSMEKSWEFYNEKILTIYNQKKMENLNEFISFYNLKSDATSQDIIVAMQNQKNEITNLQNEILQLKDENVKFQNQIKSEQENKVKVLIENAIKDKKILEQDKDIYHSLASKDFENTVKILNTIKSYVPISAQIINSNGSEKEMTFEDYRKQNPDALLKMKRENFEEYSNLYQKQYGAKPKN